MKPLRFSGKTYQDALRQAKEIFGEETIIVNSRRLPDGGMEIVAMNGDDVPPHQQPQAPIKSRETAQPAIEHPLEGFTKDQIEHLLALAKSRSQMSAPAETISRSAGTPVGQGSFDEVMSQRTAPYRRQRTRAMYPEFEDEAAVFRRSSERVAAEPVSAPTPEVAREAVVQIKPLPEPVQPEQQSVVQTISPSKAEAAESSDQPLTPSQEFERDLKAADAIAQWSKRLLGDVEGLQDNIRRKVLPRMTMSSTYAQLFERLHSIGLKKTVCHAIINSLPANILLGHASEADALNYLEQGIAQTLPVMKTPELWSEDKKIITLVGSTGIGKSTSLAKVAHRYALAEGESNVIIMTLDPDHQEPLRSHCDALGIDFDVVKEYEDLGQAITKALANYKLVLLDTAGYGHRNDKLNEHFKRLASCGHAVQPVLVLNANSDIESLEVMASTYMSVAQQHGMSIKNAIISKLDEAARVGGVLNTVAHLGLEISYQSSGNDILDGFEKANLIGMIKEAVAQSHGLEEGASLFSMEDQGARFEATRQEILSNIVKMHTALRGLRQELNNTAPTILGVSGETESKRQLSYSIN